MRSVNEVSDRFPLSATQRAYDVGRGPAKFQATGKAERCRCGRRDYTCVRLAPLLREGVAGFGRSALEAGPEPADPLLGRPVGEALGRDAAARRLLEPVVAHRRGGRQALIRVSGIEQLPLRRGAAPP